MGYLLKSYCLSSVIVEGQKMFNAFVISFMEVLSYFIFHYLQFVL